MRALWILWALVSMLLGVPAAAAEFVGPPADMAGPGLGDRFGVRERNQVENRVRTRLDNDERRPLAAEALDGMFRMASRYLREDGRPSDADRLLEEWQGRYRDVVLGITEDVGDHAAFSDWVAEWYAALEAQFGVDFMEMTHLRDIWVMNYTLPVVFAPRQGELWCAEQLARYPRDTCEDEYARHFVGTKYRRTDPYATAALHHGFAGVVAYWVVWTACEIATWGTGAFIICMPAATMTQIAIELGVAPSVSARIWRRYNP